VKWILYGGLVATAPLIATQLVPLLAPDFAYFEELFGWSALITIAGPLGLLIAVGRYNLFDVDRLIGATAAYSIVAVGFLGLVLTIVPALANALAEASGLHAGTLRIALALAAAAVVVPANRRLRPQIDRWFFPERHALERGVRDLVRSLASAETEAEVWEVVSRRIEALLRPESLVLCTRDAGAGAGFAPADGADAPRFAARGAVALALERSGAPVPLAQETSSALEPAARDALRALGASIAVPIRRARDLAACLLLGPKRSRDVYTPTDLALLATVAESASAELLRIRSRELLRRERERAAELRASKEAADEAHRVRSRFLAAASHDLRQPLHALQLFAEALAGEQAAGEDARDLARNIHRSAGALAHMLNELLDVARLDVGAVQPQLANVSLGPLLERIGSELGPVAEAKGVALRIARTRGVVRSDPMLLARIVQNLVGNAVRYTSKGRVLVGCRRSGGSLRIGVWDTGPGIAAERRAEIFREFVQLEGGDRETGLGLGLSIVDRLARLLGHRTGLASTPGRGSLFWVEAPRVEAEAAEPAREEAAGGLAGRVVAVVDDDPRVLEATRRLLGAWGCEVLAGACAAEVRAQVATARRPLEAIVADFGLAGGRTGLEAIDEIRAAAGREVPALIVTGETEPTARAAILARGLPVLQKPVAPARLRAWLAHELAGGRTGADDTGR
jgi:signal transduction histidine kinase